MISIYLTYLFTKIENNSAVCFIANYDVKICKNNLKLLPSVSKLMTITDTSFLATHSLTICTDFFIPIWCSIHIWLNEEILRTFKKINVVKITLIIIPFLKIRTIISKNFDNWMKIHISDILFSTCCQQINNISSSYDSYNIFIVNYG